MTLDDDAVKIILSTKGTMDDVSPEMKRILDYIDGKGASDKFTEELEEAVCSARQNERWRLDYMTLEYEYRQRYLEGKEEGREEGRAEGRAEGPAHGRTDHDPGVRCSVPDGLLRRRPLFRHSLSRP